MGTLKLAGDAYARRAWGEAYARLTAADADQPLNPQHLEQLAVAAHCIGKTDESTEAWGRTHTAYLEVGDVENAALAAAWCAFGLLTRGKFALGSGWLGRAQALCDEHNLDCPARWFTLGQMAAGTMSGGDYAAALEMFQETQRHADRMRDANGMTLSRLGRAQCLTQLGRGREGLQLFDEVMVAVSTDAVSPLVAGLAYCAAIESCQQILDVRRAQGWTAALTRWCEQPDLVPYRGNCHVARRLAGGLRRSSTCPRLARRRRRHRSRQRVLPARRAAPAPRGLHRPRGGVQASEHARTGDPTGPRAAASRARPRRLRDRRDPPRARRDGGRDRARAFARPAGRCGTRRRQGADRSRGSRRARHDRRADRRAAVARHGDVRRWRGDVGRGRPAGRIGVPAFGLDALAGARSAVPRRPGARADRRGVPRARRRGHRRDGARCSPLGLPGAGRGARPRPGAEAVDAACGNGTGRTVAAETQVLRLVAAGKTNRAIADELFLSEKTVHRHLSNIFTKLDVGSRSAATAYAFQHDLV